MKRRRLLLAIPGLLALAAPAAWGCGVCVEDKVAATYDHAVLQRAAANGQLVMFCGVTGRADAARLRQAAASVRGLDRASVRVSAQPAALSFALDPRRQSPRHAVAALQRALPPGTQVELIKLAGADGLQTAAAARGKR
ncbi:hypothetical protein [Ramlibacter sp.]|uniref:hypothetical protein n=1 Tax=Ramlibacter sp. TaxID=1917967 RepID=UPI002C1E658C|nr:hypothetical protein [Ramlibacter sp.]HWI81312.1 hypothetical protein [Ramlibacter sp.]